MKLATAAAANWRVHCGEGGLGSRVFCSRAQRTQQTANILIAGATGATWRDLECVYPEPGMQARMCMHVVDADLAASLTSPVSSHSANGTAQRPLRV